MRIDYEASLNRLFAYLISRRNPKEIVKYQSARHHGRTIARAYIDEWCCIPVPKIDLDVDPYGLRTLPMEVIECLNSYKCSSR